MLRAIAFVLAHWGALYFITASFIAAPMRVGIARASSLAGQLFYCPACTGFWLGALEGSVRLLLFPANEVFGEAYPPGDGGRFVVGGLIGMGLGAIWMAMTNFHNTAWTAEEHLRERATASEDGEAAGARERDGANAQGDDDGDADHARGAPAAGAYGDDGLDAATDDADDTPTGRRRRASAPVEDDEDRDE